jgi:acyl-CoA dehydrogenase
LADPTGLSMMIALEELAWGDAGICMALMGTTLAVAAIVANGTPEQQMEWVPQCYGTLDDIKLAAFGVSEPDAGSDVSSLRTRAVYDEARTNGCSTGPRPGSPTAASRTCT